MFKNSLVQLFFGLRDSFNLIESVSRYLAPGGRASFTSTIAKLFYESNYQNEHSQLIAGNTICILKKSGKFMALVLTLGYLHGFIEVYVGTIITGIVYWLIVGFIYMENALQMWVWQTEIGQEVVNMELQHYKNTAFVEYQIDTDYQIDQSAIGMIHRSFDRFMFIILFLLQTNIIGMLVAQTLFFPINYIFRIPIFALFMSVVNTNTKIPFQQHLTYYYDSHLAYLIGLNLLQSCVLHVAKFPVFTALQWALQPFFLLNSIAREPPKILMIKEQPLHKTLLAILFNSDTQLSEVVKISRDTYKEHLKGCFNSQEYQDMCKQHIGYISMPAILTPYTQQLLNSLLRYFDKFSAN